MAGELERKEKKGLNYANEGEAEMKMTQRR